MQLVRRVKTMQPSSIPMLSMSSAVASGPVLLDRSQAGHAPQHRHGGSGAMQSLLNGLALFTADIVAAALALGLAFWVAGRTHDTDGLFALLPWAGCALAGVVLHLASHGQYTRRTSRWAETARVFGASLGAFVGPALAAYLAQEDGARAPVLIGWAAFACLVFAARALARGWLDMAGLWRIPVVVVGDPANVAAASAALRSAPHLGYKIVGDVAPAHLPSMLTTGGWRGLLRERAARMIVLAYDETETPLPKLIEALVRDRVPVAVMRDTHGLPALACEQNAFPGHESMMLCYATSRDKPVSRILKAALDVCVAGVAMLALLPLFAVIAVLIKTDGGPVFFAHRRIGSFGRNFRCLKFRTMVQDSDAVLARVLESDPDAAWEWAETQKLRRDPRVTLIGRVLRKTSLDELPQLINVLRLEMSLVGPRPIVSREIGRYADDISYYYETRPGITGLWQISGRNDTTYARRVELDRWYVKNWSIGQDFSILARTIPAVLSGRGAS